MQLKPDLTAEDALRLLSLSADHAWGSAEASLLQSQLREIAQAMMVVAKFDVPDVTEPLFSSDPHPSEAGR